MRRHQYECGGASAFAASYDLSWGRVKAITRPAPGNHEYQTGGGTNCDTSGNAAGYYGYFGPAAGDPAKGYYSYDLGDWHLVALNSECGKAQGCGAGSPQEQWLRADLAAHETPARSRTGIARSSARASIAGSRTYARSGRRSTTRGRTSC